ncbi:hypothetical protein RSOLAG22IIIB_05146 [Rhizoctonia solani]|uniref:Uncharacterized protein n=1 Tax=Rhizoctonia solani TaxID=456999 RepID=A0A0K6G3I5_9AGAM|nr:hypothetical protein RSOLAG22IIIB_05146 [Rhizoctonia solani]
MESAVLFNEFWDNMFYLRDGAELAGSPNTAIAVFKSRSPVSHLLDSSQNRMGGCFWQEHAITARPFILSRDTTCIISRRFSSIVDKLVQLRLNAQQSGFDRISQPAPIESSIQSQSSAPGVVRPGPEDIEPPAKRLKTASVRVNPSVASESEPSQIPGDTPTSPEWMINRITQLEAELHTMRAERDMALSEQDVIRTAHQAEQSARRKAMAQKSAAEAALSREQVEQVRLRAELETAIAEKTALGEPIAAKGTLEPAQPTDKSSKRITTLEREFEEEQNRAHKLHLRILHMQEQHKPDTIKLDKAKAKIKQLKVELESTQEQLDSTQKLLDSKEQKYRQKYKSAKKELRACKARFDDEQMLTKKLKDSFTPEVHKSLGHMHETLGRFLFTMGLPSSEGGNAASEETT